MTICDKIAEHGATGLITNNDGTVKVYELTPANIQVACLNCKSYITYGSGTYCVRAKDWTGHTPRYQQTNKVKQ